MRGRFISSAGLLVMVAAGITAGALAPAGVTSPARSGATSTPITVTATEFKFVLSKPTVPAGTTVVFTVINKGKIAHDFKIAGKKTPSIAPGKSAKLTVLLAKKGQAAYICTLPGHVAGGMKGNFAVGVAPAAAPAATETVAAKPASTPTPAPASSAAAGPETLQGDPVAGAAVFKDAGCGGCHTLAAAGSLGNIGPNLDSRKPTQGQLRSVIQSGATAGGAIMPSFSLSPTDLNDIIAYVYKASHP